MNTKNIRELVENHNEPLVFNNLLDWNILQWKIDKWKENLGKTELQFRMGSKIHTQKPQWENMCEIIKGNFEDFLNFDQNDKWLYFDYKYLNQWFIDKHELRNDLNWQAFGFPEIKAEDSTIWIGTEGAHTPCHIDTYGCNLVAQIMGRKLWLLFPPTEDLQPTRVPYEESTIYSSINFYSPGNIELDAAKCRKVILSPGEVLFVPNGWWHYVENIEMAISVNTWIPLKNDNDKRIDEALTLLMVKSLTSASKEEDLRSIFNSNDTNDLTTIGAMNLLDTCIQCNSDSTTSDTDCLGFDVTNVDFIREIERMTSDKLREFLISQSKRFKGDINYLQSVNAGKTSESDKVAKYLKVFTDPEVIKLIRSKLIK